MSPNPALAHLCDIRLRQHIGSLMSAIARGDFGPYRTLREWAWINAAREELERRRLP